MYLSHGFGIDKSRGRGESKFTHEEFRKITLSNPAQFLVQYTKYLKARERSEKVSLNDSYPSIDSNSYLKLIQANIHKEISESIKLN